MKFLVDGKTAIERKSICEGCEFFSDKRTCGTLVIGNRVEYKGREYKLCGCFMDAKIKLRAGSCPLGKWGNKLDDETVKELKKLLDVESRIEGRDFKKLIQTFNDKFDTRYEFTKCASCVGQIIKEMKEALETYETT